MNERIKKLRKALDLTQQEFADKLGIKRNTVATYEAGKSNPSDAAVILMCKTFNVSEEWLRTGEDPMFIPISRDEEITDFVADILKDENDSFKRRFVSMLSQLNESDWEVLEKMALKLAEDNKKG